MNLSEYNVATANIRDGDWVHVSYKSLMKTRYVGGYFRKTDDPEELTILRPGASAFRIQHYRVVSIRNTVRRAA